MINKVDIFTPKARYQELVIQELADETLIYDLTTSKAFCLNPTAAFVWHHADGQTPIKQIAYLLQKKLRAPVDESIIWFALEKLAKNNLLENPVAAPQMFAGMNRRELITVAGKSAAVAIPLVFAIVAPTAAHAASGANRANGVACNSGTQCASGTCSFGKAICCSADLGGSCNTRDDCCSAVLSCSGGVCIYIPPNGAGCVLYDTPITAADGRIMRAIDVAVGEQLIGINCLNGEKVAGRVKAKKEVQTAEIYALTAASGDVIQCSPSHPLIKGFGDIDGTPIELLEVGDKVLTYDEATGRVTETKTVAVERIKIWQPVILFEMDTFEHTFISGGIVSHNKAN